MQYVIIIHYYCNGRRKRSNEKHPFLFKILKKEKKNIKISIYEVGVMIIKWRIMCH